MGQAIIRRATIDDLESIVDLYNGIIQEGLFTADLDPIKVNDRLKWFEKSNANPYGIYLMSDGDLLCGYFYFSAWRKGRRALEDVVELSYYLAEDRRGKGLGRKMISVALDQAARRSWSHIIAIMLDNNGRSRQLLEKFGFDIVGHLPDITKLGSSRCGQLILLKRLVKDS